MRTVRAALFVLALQLEGCVFGSHAPPPLAQNPSPMQEHTRRHARIPEEPPAGVSFLVTGVLPKPISVYLPPSLREGESFDLLIHFHGAAFVVNTAVSRLERPMVGVTVNLGAGSAVYERPFLEQSRFRDLLATVLDSLSTRGLGGRAPDRVFLSAFSAGYGAVSAVLQNGGTRVDGILLLDGLHTDYVPEGLVLYSGGSLNNEKLAPFVDFARLALDGRRQLIITHSEIFPGTFASTTETTDYLIQQLGLERQPVLAWGPGGMQQLSRTEAGDLSILGFAGNTAPDHVDHLHGLPEFLRLMIRP